MMPKNRLTSGIVECLSATDRIMFETSVLRPSITSVICTPARAVRSPALFEEYVMTASRHKVLIVCNQRVRDESLLPADLDRLSTMADWEWLPTEGGVAFGPNDDPDAIGQLIAHVGDVDCVVVSHGSPMISAEVMDGAPNLKIIGELEEDRFAYRIDVESAWERGIRTVDTTHGSSYPVAERALGHVPTIRVCAWDRAVRYETPKRRDTGDAGLRRPQLTQPREPAAAAVCQPGRV